MCVLKDRLRIVCGDRDSVGGQNCTDVVGDSFETEIETHKRNHLDKGKENK